MNSTLTTYTISGTVFSVVVIYDPSGKATFVAIYSPLSTNQAGQQTPVVSLMPGQTFSETQFVIDQLLEAAGIIPQGS